VKTLRSSPARPRERFVELPVDRHVEVLLDFVENPDLLLDESLLKGARVKPVVVVPEERVETFDREALRKAVLKAGAESCRPPEVRVVRKRVKRDERHAADVPLEESLRIFAAETRARDAGEKVSFAAELAREADAGAVV